MNKKGHTQTLVAAQPGNRNAVKSGVFSPATLAPRILELESAIAGRPLAETHADLLRRELAALAALSEAMDESLASDGVQTRSRQPRTLVSLRLRLNEKMRRTLEEYVRVVGSEQDQRAPELGSATPEPAPAEQESLSLPESIAFGQARNSIREVTPAELDPDAYLASVIQTADPAVTTQARLRARRMLTKRSKNRPETCLCFSTRKARDELEFRSWIDDARSIGCEQMPDDARIAALVRQVAGGEMLERWAANRQAEEAVYDVLSEGAARARGDSHERAPWTGEGDRAVDPFWQIVLSASSNVTAADRLKAFAALDEMDALPQCACKPRPHHELIEHRSDAWSAYTIRLVAKKNIHAALHVAYYPETYCAVRDVIDAKIVEELEGAPDDGASAEVSV